MHPNGEIILIEIAQVMASTDISHAEIREYFLQLAKHPDANKQCNVGDVAHEHKQEQVDQLINAYRTLWSFSKLISIL